MQSSYYLFIDGLNGGLNSSNIALDGGFDFGIQNLFSIGPISRSSSAVKALFSLLDVGLILGAALPILAKALSKGTVIDAVQIKGVSGAGDVLYDLRLGQVADLGTGRERDGRGPAGLRL